DSVLAFSVEMHLLDDTKIVGLRSLDFIDVVRILWGEGNHGPKLCRSLPHDRVVEACPENAKESAFDLPILGIDRRGSFDHLNDSLEETVFGEFGDNISFPFRHSDLVLIGVIGP